MKSYNFKCKIYKIFCNGLHSYFTIITNNNHDNNNLMLLFVCLYVEYECVSDFDRYDLVITCLFFCNVSIVFCFFLFEML